jgi:hypothetical protein
MPNEGGGRRRGGWQRGQTSVEAMTDVERRTRWLCAQECKLIHYGASLFIH